MANVRTKMQSDRHRISSCVSSYSATAKATILVPGLEDE
jgi:hypothetical protein